MKSTNVRNKRWHDIQYVHRSFSASFNCIRASFVTFANASRFTTGSIRRFSGHGRVFGSTSSSPDSWSFCLAAAYALLRASRRATRWSMSVGSTGLSLDLGSGGTTRSWTCFGTALRGRTAIDRTSVGRMSWCELSCPNRLCEFKKKRSYTPY